MKCGDCSLLPLRVVSWVLRLYPRRFRSGYGAEVQQVQTERFGRTMEARGRTAASIGLVRAAFNLAAGALHRNAHATSLH